MPPVLLAAVGAEHLKEAWRIARRQPVVVWGTMDGAVLSAVGKEAQVYFYEAG